MSLVIMNCRLLWPCPIIRCIVTSKLRDGSWAGHGRRRKWSGTWLGRRQETKEIAPSSMVTCPTAAVKNLMWSTCFPAFLTTSKLRIAAEVVCCHPFCKILPLQWGHTRLLWATRATPTRQSNCRRTSLSWPLALVTLVAKLLLCRIPSSCLLMEDEPLKPSVSVFWDQLLHFFHEFFKDIKGPSTVPFIHMHELNLLFNSVRGFVIMQLLVWLVGD